MFKKIALLLLLVFIGIFVYFAYPIIKLSYEKKDIPNQLKESPENKENENKSKLEESITEQGSADQSGNNSNISARDCDNECGNFKNEEKKLKYCQEVCGLSSEEIIANCSNKSGLEKDYCFKSLAIQNKDFKICDQISDSGIKKTCKNRITEDIME